MNNFLEKCKNEVIKHYNNEITEDKIYFVWFCKTLNTAKALLSTAIPNDTTYFEFTYNGDKNEIYVDVYSKNHNYLVKVESDLF